jgi:hypothetical protein
MKAEHGLNHNEAQWAAWAVTDPGRMESYSRPHDLLEELYAGKRAPLRPIHEALLAAALAAGDGVTVNVCKTYSSLSAKTQFAILALRTLKAVDLELALPEGVDHPRLEPFKGSNPKFRHRVRVTDAAQVDDEVRGWLAAAAAFSA